MTSLHGSWIWYELMSPDPAGSKAFYEAVVGWSISTGHGDDTNYGFIANPDGHMTGGLMRLTAEMQAHGAGRAGWVTSGSMMSMPVPPASQRRAARC